METVRWGTLGCARVFNRRMVPGFHAAAGVAELLAVSSRSLEKARETAAQHNIPRAYGSYEELLADSEIDAVYIPLPNDLHAEWTIRALEAGKHVLCDKPAALTYADARRMAETAQHRNLRLMEGFMWRHHPQHQRVRELLDSGAIGPLTHFRGAFTYPAAPDPSNIRWQKDKGGGSLLDVGVYPVNAARYFFGEEPVAVQAVSRLDDTTGVDRHTAALLEWVDGRTASTIGGFDQVFTTRYELVGETGSITAERAFQVGEAGVTLTIRRGDDVQTEFFPHTDQYGEEIAHFSRCVRNPELPLSPGEDGSAQTLVVEAIHRAMHEKRRVRLNEISV
ncbi:MAG: Gfo/Idh/MocA family oxidoreductase [Armatimonadaceae bacterium]